MTKKAQQDIARKLKVLQYPQEIGNVAKTCRYFGICRQTFYAWRKTFAEQGMPFAQKLIGKSSEKCLGVQKTQLWRINGTCLQAHTVKILRKRQL